MSEMRELMSHHAASGTVKWIGLRPARREGIISVDTATIALTGLEGDRREKPGKRAVSLIQWEHLPVIASLAGLDGITPEMLRRNIAVAGINLLALRGNRIQIGTAILLITGPCAPCSRMEAIMGHGGYNAMRGHGGVTAEVVLSGEITLGDTVTAA